MPRPRKCRFVCEMPAVTDFGPIGGEHEEKIVSMSVEEFESIRLIDLEGLNQQECADRMNVARTTAQAIYNSARCKIAECLVKGVRLSISGGDYVLYEGKSPHCGCAYCHKKRCHTGEEK